MSLVGFTYFYILGVLITSYICDAFEFKGKWARLMIALSWAGCILCLYARIKK